MTENYFELFDMPFTFHVNQGELRKKYLENSRKFHPDLASEDAEAEEKSSMNNEGFRVLKDFFATVHYILQQKDILKEGEKEKLDPLFLGEMMEINEGLMELEFDFDQLVFDKISAEAAGRLKNIEKSLEDKAQQFDATSNEALLDQIKTDYLKRKYLLRIKDSIDKFAAS